MLNIHKNTSLACIKLHTANPKYIRLNIHKKHIISNMQKYKKCLAEQSIFPLLYKISDSNSVLLVISF